MNYRTDKAGIPREGVGIDLNQLSKNLATISSALKIFEDTKSSIYCPLNSWSREREFLLKIMLV